MQPLVYAIVLNHNGEQWLERCLSSLVACAYPNLRVLLVDNASTDASVSLARGISPRIEILQNPANLGFCAGNNAGIDYALSHGADYVALLNNDTYFDPGWVDRLVEVGETQPHVGILGPVQLVFDGADFNSWTTTALPHLLADLRRNDRPGAWFPVEWVEGSCLVAKRAVFERVGRFDPIFFIFFEECDLCRRARSAGFEVAIVPSSKIHHYRGGFFGQARHLRRRQFLYVRNSMIYNSTDPALPWLRNFLRLLRNNATHFRSALSRPRDLPLWFQATCSVALGLPGLYRKWRADRAVVSSDRVCIPS